MVALSSCLLAGCQTGGGAGSRSEGTYRPPPSAKAYVLKPLDKIVIGIGKLGAPALDEIDAEGNINLQFIPVPVKASGKTASGLERHILDLYVNEYKIYRRQQLTVTVNVPMKLFTVGGEVQRPGQYPLTSGMTLTRAISVSGGFTSWSQKGQIMVTRDSGEKVIRSWQKMIEDPSQDVVLLAGDRIYVRKGWR